jgi:hypothetical protein
LSKRIVGNGRHCPECLDDFIDESNPVRVIDVFVDALDLAEMSFEGIEPAATRTKAWSARCREHVGVTGDRRMRYYNAGS